MYAASVIEKRQAEVEKATGLILKRRSVADSLTLKDHLASLKRPPTTEEQAFIANEKALCAIDFRYFAERYVEIEYDGGSSGPLKFKESQEIALTRYLAPSEEQMMEQVEAGEVTDGLRFYWHKARQLYATTTARALTFHRLVFQRDVRAMFATASDEQINPIYNRDKRLIGGLPSWLRPSLSPDDDSFDVKDGHIYFGTLKSGLVYHSGTTKGNIGQGSQFDIQHITEAAFWPNPEYQIDYILNPATPQSERVLCIRESTANGRGNWWHEQSEDARHHRSSWGYIFMPWYVVSSKRRRRPPDSNWRPDPITLRHADLVLQTSPEWVGRPVTLDREQLYWWESERKEHQKKEGLAVFYTNYCATPEESFQWSGTQAFTPEQIERWRLQVSIPAGLEVVHK